MYLNFGNRVYFVGCIVLKINIFWIIKNLFLPFLNFLCLIMINHYELDFLSYAVAILGLYLVVLACRKELDYPLTILSLLWYYSIARWSNI